MEYVKKMYYSRENNVIISKSFKTAGSSLYELIKKNKRNGVLINNHFTIKEFKEKNDAPNATGIVGIRNPWDYVVSAFFWSLKNKECPSQFTFEDFVLKNSKFNWKKQHKWWEPTQIDDVVVFEDLQNEVNRIGIKYNIAEIVGKKIGHRKKSKIRPKDYREMYENDNLIGYVGEEFSKEIEFFNNKFNIEYTFENGIKYNNPSIQQSKTS